VTAALEPDTPDSWFAQRVLPAMTSAARVMAPPQPALMGPPDP